MTHMLYKLHNINHGLLYHNWHDSILNKFEIKSVIPKYVSSIFSPFLKSLNQ